MFLLQEKWCIRSPTSLKSNSLCSYKMPKGIPLTDVKYSNLRLRGWMPSFGFSYTPSLAMQSKEDEVSFIREWQISYWSLYNANSSTQWWTNSAIILMCLQTAHKNSMPYYIYSQISLLVHICRICSVRLWKRGIEQHTFTWFFFFLNLFLHCF